VAPNHSEMLEWPKRPQLAGVPLSDLKVPEDSKWKLRVFSSSPSDPEASMESRMVLKHLSGPNVDLKFFSLPHTRKKSGIPPADVDFGM
jgi:hypothetical protein